MLDNKRKRDLFRKWMTALLAVLACAAVLNFAVSAAHRSLLQRGIAEEVLRFHVLANSDSEEDQSVKYLVRDAVLEWLRGELRSTDGVGMKGVDADSTDMDGAGMNDADADDNSMDSTDMDGAGMSDADADGNGTDGVDMDGTGMSGADVDGNSRDSADMDNADTGGGGAESGGKEYKMRFLAAHLREIEQIADRILEEQGMAYRAQAAVENCYFPERTYGECTFPAGWYDALRIRLGEARGRNWWCVLYPGLCFSDCLHAVVDEDELADLKEVLTVEEYENLLRRPDKWKISFRWF